MAEIEVPPYFLCPITLQIMKDPVTVSTGITYDRESIEKWLFSHKNSTCPVTKLPISGAEAIPNITLRRLIQSWCLMHTSDGFERHPTPKAPITKSQVLKLLKDSLSCLKKLKSMASQSETNKRCIEMAGAGEYLSLLIIKNAKEDKLESRQLCDEAISILYGLQLTESSLKAIANQEFVESLTSHMQSRNLESRAFAIMLLKSLLEVADLSQVIINLKDQFFVECNEILGNEISQKFTKDTLKVLINVCQLGRNRIKAVEAGAVHILVDILLNSHDKRTCEMSLILLDLLCQCAEGRSELLTHSAGLAVVSKKILRISHLASERGVKILHSISRFCATPGILNEMLQIGVAAKLCLVIQTDCGIKMKEKCREMLKLHARAWRNPSCIPGDLICSYPSS